MYKYVVAEQRDFKANSVFSINIEFLIETFY